LKIKVNRQRSDLTLKDPERTYKSLQIDGTNINIGLQMAEISTKNTSLHLKTMERFANMCSFVIHFYVQKLNSQFVNKIKRYVRTFFI
jgi:PP-loop superfamily ATP-utilizing enzyme